VIWDAAGDLAVGTGADTAARLAKGNAGGYLAMGNSAVIWNAGTAFPASKATNDRYWRTDLGMEFFWDGTRWVTTTLYHYWNALPNASATTAYQAITSTGVSPVLQPTPRLGGGSDVWLDSLTTTFFVSGGTALDRSNNWSLLFTKRPTGNTDTTLVTVTINSGSLNVWRADTQSIAALMNNGTVHYVFSVNPTKTGTPGGLIVGIDLTYRIVAT
jgi:hypothetical protein